MFRSVPIATVRIKALDPLPSTASGYRRDTVTLGWEDRIRIRARRTSDSGFEFATTLDRGTVLADGDRLVVDAAQLIVDVRERLEPVFVIRPASAEQSALFGYHIGNSHQPMMLAADGIVCAALPGMEQVLAYHSIPFTRELRAFTPVNQIPDHRHALGA